MYSVEEKIKWFAIFSRLVVFLLQFIGNYLISDHDAKVFLKPKPSTTSEFDSYIVEPLTDGLTRWDGQYFLHIAEHGYTYENTLAFFPLFPLILRFLAYPFQVVVNNAFHITAVPFFLTTHSALVLMSLVLNNVLFVHSALLLHKLTLKITSNEKISYLSSLLFCVNPASVFFSAVYSETLFCFLTLNGMLYIESGHVIWGSLVFGLSGFTRSNGIINVGYVFYRLLKTKTNVLSLVFGFVVLISSLILSLFPFIFYQMFCYHQFCVEKSESFPEIVKNYGFENGYLMPGNASSSWCSSHFPLAYSYVQDHYWGVGFLKYYEKKQVPNFVLAFPVLALTFFGTFKFVRSHGWGLLKLGLIPGFPTAPLPPNCVPYVLHALFLSFFGLFCMHVQVTTRLIFSSCPVIYWFLAEVLARKMGESREAAAARRLSKNANVFYEPLENRKSRWKTLILTERFLGLSLIIRYYFFAYFMAGPVIYSNFLPWT